MNKITVVYPVYNASQACIGEHVFEWDSWPKSVKIILVDDFSKHIPFAPGVTIARITEDRGYNPGGAANLGVFLSDTPWILKTDIDHFIPSETIIALQGMRLNKSRVYRFTRPGRTPHINSFLIHVDAFNSVGGYDEDLSGPDRYGSEDHLLAEMLTRKGIKSVILPQVIREKSTYATDMPRPILGNMRRYKAKIADPKYKNGKTLRFKWEVICDE